jgi:hypothetical protein
MKSLKNTTKSNGMEKQTRCYILKGLQSSLWLDSEVAANLLDFAEKFAGIMVTQAYGWICWTAILDEKFYSSRNYTAAGNFIPISENVLYLL